MGEYSLAHLTIRLDLEHILTHETVASVAEFFLNTTQIKHVAELPVESFGCEGLPSPLLPPHHQPRQLKGHHYLLIRLGQNW